MMKTFATAAIGAALAFVVGSAPAQADGMARGARGAAAGPMGSYGGGGCGENNFGGFFAGVHGGFTTLQSRTDDRDYFLGIGEKTHDEDAFTFGGQIGFNVQKCAVVWGVVADLSWADMDSEKSYYSPTLYGNYTAHRSADWYGSIRTRLGLAFDGLWLYTTGGIAFANFGLSGDDFNGNGYKLFDDKRVGWVGGVGTEYKWSDRVSIVSEALYYDFGTETSSLSYGGYDYKFDDHQSMWVTRIGINFKLGDHGMRHADVGPPMK